MSHFVWNQLPPHILQSTSLSTCKFYLSAFVGHNGVIDPCLKPTNLCSQQLEYSQEHTEDHKAVSYNI